VRAESLSMNGYACIFHQVLIGEIEVRHRVERIHVHPHDLVVLSIRKLSVMVELIERCPPSGLATFIITSACRAIYTSGRPKT
jgi:hypothetical protein